MRRLVIVAAVLLTGCGGEASSSESFTGEEREVAEAVEEIQSAAERRDAERICRELIATELRDRLGQAGSSCDREVEKAIKDADVFALDVEDVTVTGTTAEADVTGDEKRSATLRLVKEDGRWRATSFGS